MKRVITTLMLTVFAAAALTGCSTMNQKDQTCTVESKDRSTSDGVSVYRVYTEQCGVLGIEDALFQGNFNSADVYSKIEEGKTYQFKTAGWRNGPLSLFPNIIEVK